MNYINQLWQSLINNKSTKEIKLIDNLNSTINLQSIQNLNLSAQNEDIVQKYSSLKKEYERLLNEGKLSVVELIEWFEGNRSKESWIYDGERLGRVDVKKYLGWTPEGEKILTEAALFFIDKYKLSNIKSSDKVPESLMKYFKSRTNWRYKYDPQKFGKPEFWQVAEKSWLDKEGDCDDLAILMNILAYFIFKELGKIKEYRRLTFTCGKLLNEGGHAFNTWLHNDGKYYAVESTYDLSGSYYKTWLKTPIVNNNLYQAFWGFSTIYKSWKGSMSFFKEYKPKEV